MQIEQVSNAISFHSALHGNQRFETAQKVDKDEGDVA